MSAFAQSNVSTAIGVGCVAAALAIGFAAPASADYDTVGYVNALDAAGLIDHDSDHCNIINGLCHGQFDDGPSSVATGMWVCR